MKGSWRVKGNGYELRAGSVSRMFHGNAKARDRALRKLVAEVESGALGKTDTTVEDLLVRWLKHKQSRVEVLTFEGYRQKVEFHIIPGIGKVKLAKLTADRLDQFYDSDLPAKGIGPRTIIHIHRILSQALKQAVLWRMVTENVASQVTPPPAPKKEMVIPTASALERFTKGLYEKNPLAAAFFFLASTTGARRGELVGLRWSRVDLEHATISIERAVALSEDFGIIEKGTKRKRARAKIALDPASVAVLRLLKEQAEADAITMGTELLANGYVFTDTFDGSQPWNPTYPTNAWRYHRDTYGLTGVRLHDCRHYLATLLLANGIPVEAVSQRLGHAKTSTTLDIYSHLLEATDQEAAAVIGSVVRPLALTQKTPAEAGAEVQGSKNKKD